MNKKWYSADGKPLPINEQDEHNLNSIIFDYYRAETGKNIMITFYTNEELKQLLKPKK